MVQGLCPGIWGRFCRELVWESWAKFKKAQKGSGPKRLRNGAGGNGPEKPQKWSGRAPKMLRNGPGGALGGGQKGSRSSGRTPRKAPEMVEPKKAQNWSGWCPKRLKGWSRSDPRFRVIYFSYALARLSRAPAPSRCSQRSSFAAPDATARELAGAVAPCTLAAGYRSARSSLQFRV